MLSASALRGAPAAKANRCLRLIASALLRDGSRGLPPLPSRYGGSIPQTKTFKTSANAEVLNVVTGLLVLIQMRGLWKLNKYACFPLLSSQGGDSGLDRVHLVSAPNLAPESSYPKKLKTLRASMRANPTFAKWLGFCENVASEMASVLSRYTTTNRFSASSSGTLSQSSENPLHQAFRHLRQLGIFPTSYCPF